MLVLSRKKGETIVIKNRQTGSEIKIALVNIVGQKVRIGIDASDDERIRREEIINREKKHK